VEFEWRERVARASARSDIYRVSKGTSKEIEKKKGGGEKERDLGGEWDTHSLKDYTFSS